MSIYRTIVVGFSTILLTAAWSAAWSADRCQQEFGFVESQSLCFADQGIPLTVGNGKAGCFAEPGVQHACGPDGRLTRLHAWADWLRELRNFQDHCAEQHGDFAFADPQFTEPADENFCLPAQPELGSSFFEEPTCNFRSICPTVQVVCHMPCHDYNSASLPYNRS